MPNDLQFLLSIDSSNISNSFNRIAEELFNNYLIQVNNNLYRLLEFEFYYKDNDQHNDPYVHGHKMQTKSGYWYFHGSGMDLTFGSENIYGGILLRSVEKISSEPLDKKAQYIFGPLNVQTELLSGLNSAIDGGPNKFNLVLALDRIMKVKPEDIIKCQRIGLAEKDSEADKYHKAHYRYLIYPHLAHKEKTKIALVLKEKLGSDKSALDKIKKMLGSEFLKEYR